MGNSACSGWDHDKCFSSDYEKFSLIGSIGDLPADFWNAASVNIQGFQHRDKVKHLFLNHGFVNGNCLTSLSHFSEVEELTLGINIEGLTIPPDDFRNILKFKKVTYLHIALHGLQNEHFKIISEMKGLISLGVNFGTRLMQRDNSTEFKEWVPVMVDDIALGYIAQIDTLEQLFFRRMPEKEGRINFTKTGIVALLKAPKLKYVLVTSGNLTKEAIQIIREIKSLNGEEIVIEDLK